MNLKDLIIAVKEKNLTKDQLEDYRDEMSNVYAEMQIELAEIEKSKALFFENNKMTQKVTTKGNGVFSENVERSDISVKRMFGITPEGQREIVLKRYCLATKELLNSLKSRLYSIY